MAALTMTPAEPVREKELGAIQGAQGTREFFIGSWTAAVEYNGSFDTYTINISANGRCTVKLTNDTGEQETAGNWDYDGSMFRLNAVFSNPPIAYQRAINWVYRVNFLSDYSFRINAYPAANSPLKTFDFYRQ